MSDESKIEILQMGSYPDWDQKPLDDMFHMHRYFESDKGADFITPVAPSIRAIATRGELGASRALIEQLPKLEIIAVYGVGYDAVDIAACKERGVKVTNTPDVLTEDVADLGVGMMLAQSRDISGAEKWARDGSWAHKGAYPLQHRVFGKKAGILGLGRIGYEVAKRLIGFGINIAYSSREPRDYGADWLYIKDPVRLAAWSDFLFVTLAASAETHHIVNKEVIEAVGHKGMIINISRASNLDEEALLEALETGTLGSAALDVFADEPHLDPRFLTLDNVLLQPHHASGTFETRQAMGQLMRDNLTAYFNGKPLLTEVV